MTKLRHWLKDHFRTELIKEINSKHNGLIQVIKVFDRPRLMIGEMIQSGGMVKKIWSKAMGKLANEGHKCQKALILGLGCGDCAHEVNRFYPKAKMIGVEIDKQVVEVAKAYFDLAVVKHLKIAVDEGQNYVQKLVKRKKVQEFDLVIVDVYLGRKMPLVFRQKRLYQNVKKLLSKNGVVVINHLFFGLHKKQAKELIKKLDKVFKKIVLQRTASNLLIFGYKN